MNIKHEKKRSSTGSSTGANSIKILNDEKLAMAMVSMPIMTTVSLSPTKHVSMSIAKSKKSTASRKKNMDHYVLKNIKAETNDENEAIDFILAEDDANEQQNGGLGGPSGEITEELHLTGDEEAEGEEKTEEIVEHVCGRCYKTFRRFNGLKKHLDFCRFDSGYHLRKAEMLKNLDKIEKDATIMENKDVCFCCGESYDTFHLGHINCPDCPKSFKSQMSYERHIFITHSEFNNYPCNICNAKMRSENLLKLHVDQHQNRGKPFACKICGKDFTRSYHLKRHQKYSMCSQNYSDAMNCKVCNKIFFRLDNLRAHLKQHLGTAVAKKPEYMCPICKNCFYSLSTLNIHTRVHTGERPFDCDLCDKKFPSLVALKKHRRYHTGEKPYTCSVCNQSFAVKEVLNRHMKRHTGERPHVCSECGKSFIQATQLKSHLKTHIRPYQCDECNEKFKTEKQLERHSKTHNRSNTKRRLKVFDFKCDICQAAFRREEQLSKHMEFGRHIGKKERNKRMTRTDCAICEKNFDTVKSLQFHILKVHEVDPEDFINEKPSAEDNQAEEDATPAAKRSKIVSIEDNPLNQIEFITSTQPITYSGKKKVSDASDEIGDIVGSSSSGVHVDGSGVLVQEFIVDEMPSTSAKQTIIIQNGSFTVIPLHSDGGIIEPVTTNTMPAQISAPEATATTQKVVQRKTLAESLAAAIADDDDEAEEVEEEAEEKHTAKVEAYSEEDIKLKENVGKLLDMLVDNDTLKKFGWPNATEEDVLCKVIENCGHELSKDSDNYQGCDYATRMREYVKLLFTVVIHNDSIKELLNNYPIDEVIEYVLGNDDDDDDDEEREEVDDDN